MAVIPVPPLNDLVADFVPELRKRAGTYQVEQIPEMRFRALFYSNRAIETLMDGDLPGAMAQTRRSLDSDPKSTVGWNVLGVVEAAMEHLVKAEEAYRHAIALDPKDGAPIGNLENLLRGQGRLEEAAQYREPGRWCATRIRISMPCWRRKPWGREPGRRRGPGRRGPQDPSQGTRIPPPGGAGDLAEGD